MDIKPKEKQEILEAVDLAARMDRVSWLLSERIEILRLSNEIGLQTKATFDERQRKAILREQMATIQRELRRATVRSRRSLSWPMPSQKRGCRRRQRAKR